MSSALQASLNIPRGIAVDGSGNLYIADTANNAVRVVLGNGNIYTVAGNTVAGYQVYGALLNDTTLGKTYVIGISATNAADPVIGANTFIYLDTDQNTSTASATAAGSGTGRRAGLACIHSSSTSCGSTWVRSTSVGIST